MQRAFGYGMQGDQLVTVNSVTSSNVVMGSFPRCTVEVFLTGTTTHPPGGLFSDNGITPLGNPFTSDINGYWFFYVANGRYDVKLSGGDDGGFPAPFTLSDILLADGAGSTSVTSFNGRIGAVLPAQNDYKFGQLSDPPFLISSEYNFSAITPGGSLSIGSNTVTITGPIPPGMNGTNTNYYVYISGGTGTAEACLVTGGTAVSGGGTGTLIITCANTHSGAWTLASASAGIIEAVNALPSSGGIVFVLGSATAYNIYGPMIITKSHVTIRGAGSDLEHNNGGTPVASSAATILSWQGGATGPIVRFTAVAGATNLAYTFGGLEDLLIEGNGVATIGAQLISCYNTAVRNVSIQECVVVDLETNVVAGTLEGGNTITGNGCQVIIDNVSLSNYQTAGGQAGIGLRMTGNGAVANSNDCQIYGLRVIHSNAPAMELLDCDSSIFIKVGVAWSTIGSPAAGILLDASLSGAVIEDNTFIKLDPGPKGILAQNGAIWPTILNFDQANGSPVPPCTLINNGVGGLSGTVTCLSDSSNIGLWAIATPVNVVGSLSYTRTITTTSSTSFTAAAGSNMIHAILNCTANAPIACLTDTAAHIVAALGSVKAGESGAGASFDWWIRNAGNNTVTVSAGSGITLSGTVTIPTMSLRHFSVTCTNCNPGTEAVFIISLEASAL